MTTTEGGSAPELVSLTLDGGVVAAVGRDADRGVALRVRSASTDGARRDAELF
jgi:hypothetical protein